MKKVIIGSTAIKHHFPHFPREPKDLDIAVEFPKEKSRKGIEYLENPKLFKWVSQDEEYLTPNMLLNLKVSHLFFDINWDKHMWDVQFLLKEGCKWDMTIIEELYNFWKEFHPRHRRSNPSGKKDEFFNNAINYDTIEHDSLHEILNPHPMYKRILVDGEEVQICPNKFNNLSHDEKLDVVREEVWVMAYERFKGNHFMSANSKMLKKFIMQHAPIWMFPFVVENYITLIRTNKDFISILDDGLKQIQNK